MNILKPPILMHSPNVMIKYYQHLFGGFLYMIIYWNVLILPIMVVYGLIAGDLNDQAANVCVIIALILANVIYFMKKRSFMAWWTSTNDEKDAYNLWEVYVDTRGPITTQVELRCRDSSYYVVETITMDQFNRITMDLQLIDLQSAEAHDYKNISLDARLLVMIKYPNIQFRSNDEIRSLISS